MSTDCQSIPAPAEAMPEVTPEVLRAVATFIVDSGVIADVARMLQHLAFDLELQQKVGGL